MDEHLKMLTEEFVTERIAEHGETAPAEQTVAGGDLDTSYKILYSTLSEEQKRLLITVEKAQQFVSVQTERHFYRAGFTDAVKFLTQFTEA